METTKAETGIHSERRKNWITTGFVIGFAMGVATAGLLIWYWQNPSIMAEAKNSLGNAVIRVTDEGTDASIFFPSGIYHFEHHDTTEGLVSTKKVRLRKRTTVSASVKWIDPHKAFVSLDGDLQSVWDSDRWRDPTEEEK